MSVLNQMLRDLEARGESALTPMTPIGPSATPRPTNFAAAPASPSRSTRRARIFLWSFTLAVVAATAALWQWREYQVRAAGNVRDPLGFAEFKGALGSDAALTSVPAAIAPTAAATDSTRPERSADVTIAAPATSIVAAASTAPPPATPAVRVAAATTETSRRAPRVRVSTPAASAPAHNQDNVVRRSDAGVIDAEVDIARAADLIARGRSTDASVLLRRALALRPQHVAARRALAALQAEAGSRDAALMTLLEGAAVEPTTFAPLAAALQVELGDGAGALSTLARVPLTARTPQHRALTAGIAQRLGRHHDAIDEYRRALSGNASEPAWWVGLGVSLEALGQRSDAHGAYERAASHAAMSAELRQFTTQKLAQLGATKKSPPGEALVSAQP
jgi:tetratricopeptide (TPR) repeat protein